MLPVINHISGNAYIRILANCKKQISYNSFHFFRHDVFMVPALVFYGIVPCVAFRSSAYHWASSVSISMSILKSGHHIFAKTNRIKEITGKRGNYFMKKQNLILIALIFIATGFATLYAQDYKGLVDNNYLSSKDSVAPWSMHFQFTNIIQSHPSFKSKYSGMNSFKSTAENGVMSISSSLFLGRKLWEGGALQINPEITGGVGMSDALGIAAFPNGEVFRIDDPDPKIYIGRLFFQQIIPLKNTQFEHAESDANQLAGKIPTSRLVINFGKLNMGDFFDDNRYAHDPRTQFFNWVLMDQGSWDYPANTRGYTQGIVVELIKPKWEFRAASTLLPDIANGPDMDYNWY